ncbi:MAG: TIGR00730 family Rossman fold protein, partial [Vicinamibacterales bacterium]
MKRICVFAGSSVGARPQYGDAARALGRALTARGLGLVYGGARVGLMGLLADEVLAGGGEAIGVIPRALADREVAHNGLTALHLVGSMHERKALMSDLSDGFVAIPGGWGTLEEWFEVLTWVQLGLHQKPCGLLNVAGYFDGLLRFLDQMVTERFVRLEQSSLVIAATAPGELLDRMETQVMPVVEKWI